MNIEAKKLSFIQVFQNLLHKSKSKDFEDNLIPMTVEQLNSEIDLAIENEKNNKITTAIELKQKIQEWS